MKQNKTMLILLLSLLALGITASAETIDVAIEGFAFTPNDLTISVGTTVRWTNNDAAPHTSTSDDMTTWDSGTLTTGQDWSFTFTEAGAFPYHCEIHPSMTANITVTARPVPSLGFLGMILLTIMLIGTGFFFSTKRNTAK